MKLSELEKQYPNGELTSPMGDPLLRHNLFSPIMKNMLGKKAVYHERYPSIITIQDIEISPNHFKAKAVFQRLVDKETSYPIFKEWTFGAAWRILHISGNKLAPYSSWLLWIDEDIVQQVEKLVLGKRHEEARDLLDYWSR